MIYGDWIPRYFGKRAANLFVNNFLDVFGIDILFLNEHIVNY